MSFVFIVPQLTTVAQHYSSHVAFGSDILTTYKSTGEFLNSPLRYVILETQMCFQVRRFFSEFSVIICVRSL